MLLDDAAMSSVNGNRNSVEFGSQAGRTSVLSGLGNQKLIQYMSLGSVGSPLKKSIEEQNSQV